MNLGMITIYGVHRSRASRNIWLAHELGIPFKLVPVMQRYRLKEPIPTDIVHTKSPSFLKVNPNGHVPTMEDDGLVLHESLAINLYLAKKHGGPLAPANVLEDALADGFLVGGRFTVADINVAEIVRYADGAVELFKAAPRAKAWFEACRARPAYRRMWDAREKEPA